MTLPALRRRFATALSVAGVLGAPTLGLAQAQRSCILVAPTANVNGITLAGGGRIVYVSRPHMRCQDGVFIRADSAVVYSAQNMSHLMGNVVFREGSQELRADEARYFTQQGRLSAEGNLFVRDTVRGTEIENGDLIYFRRTEFRDTEQMTVTTGARDRIRPRARLFMRAPAAEEAARVDGSVTVVGAEAPPDSAVAVAAADTAVRIEEPPDSAEAVQVLDTLQAAAEADSAVVEPPDSVAAAVAAAPVPTVRAPLDSAQAAPTPRDTVPYVIEANRIVLEGSESFLGTGRVEIVRDSLRAFADTAEYDERDGRLRLRTSARVVSSTYELVGESIVMDLPGGEMRTVRAMRRAVLTGEDLLLTSPVIQIYLQDGGLERLVAVPMSPADTVAGVAADSADLVRPVADAEDFQLTADSLDVLAPGEVLDRILAAGSARGESRARDSLNVETLPGIALHDWMEGDTVIATFRLLERAPEVVDSLGNEYSLDRLEASGSARSLYRLEPSDSASRPGVDAPAVHYVRGSRITIVLLGGEVDRMEVVGPTEGYHMEPLPRRAAADSTTAPDSLAVPDSLRADTIRAGIGVGSRTGGSGDSGPNAPPKDDGGERAMLPARPDKGSTLSMGGRG